MQHTGNITVQTIVPMRLRTFSHKLRSFSITTIILFPHQQAQCPILAFFIKVKITKYKQQNGTSEVASFPGNHPAIQIWELNIALSPGVCKKQRSTWYTLFAHAFNHPRWGLWAIFGFAMSCDIRVQTQYSKLVKIM